MFGKGQGMGPGRGQSMGQAGSGRPGATAITTGKGYHVIPPKSGRGAKLPVVPGTVPANTGGTFGRLFGGGKSDNVQGVFNQQGAGGARSAMGNRGGNVGAWRSGQQSRSLDADYYMDGQGGPGNTRSQLDTVVEAGRGVRKLPAQPGGVNTLPMQNQSGLTVGPGNMNLMPQQPGLQPPGGNMMPQQPGLQPHSGNMMPQQPGLQPPASSHNMQNGVGMGGQNPLNRFNIAGTAVTALHCMQPGAPNGSAVNVVNNPGVMPMDGGGYGPQQGNMMDMGGGGNQFQTEVQVMPQQQPSVQFAQPEWT